MTASREDARGPDPDNAFVERRPIPGAPGGPLTGISFAVKDNIAVAGMRFTAGHPLFEMRRADDTAPAVRLLLDAGADFVGMTATDAGGFGATTPQTANPVFPGRVVGGSSGGSAAAVARGLCDFAVGTDTGGSVRIPAACTGLVAFKPTMGRVPNGGVWPLAASMDHVGLIARDLALLQRTATVLLASGSGSAASRSAGASSPARGPLRIAVESDGGELWDRAVAEAVDRAADALRTDGHDVRRIALGDRMAIADAHGILVLTEAAKIYDGLDAAERERLGDAARRALRYAGTIAPAAIAAAEAVRAEIRTRIAAVFAGHDLLISPTLPVPPPAAGQRRLAFGGEDRPVVVALTCLTCLANMTGSPAVALPLAAARGEWPVSLQLTGPVGADEALLAAARRIPILRGFAA